MNRRSDFLVFSLIGVSAFAIALATSAGAATRAEQKKACRGDAFHFCAADIPDREKIIACLKRHLSELKPACQAMFNEDPDQNPEKGASAPDDAAS
ncbi:MAG TPA: cysteine rich repeat-containing protein [Paraburkholderia sp.]|nr:cysteine rich repeat-containing protein [Paraburkholderia sp.]